MVHLLNRTNMTSIILQLLTDGVFAAIAAIGFSSISNPPRNAFAYCATLAAIGHMLRLLLTLGHVHIIIASFAGATAIGVLAVFCAPRIKCPPETLSFPALLPMIPGMYAYRTVQGLVQCLANSNEETFQHYLYILNFNGFTCTFIILAMVIGVTTPIFAFKNISFSATKQ